MTDRLDLIKDRLGESYSDNWRAVAELDVIWLVGEVERLRQVVSVGSARVLCRKHWDGPDDINYGDLGCPICIRNEMDMYRHGLEAAVARINAVEDSWSEVANIMPSPEVTVDDFLPADRVRVSWLEGES